MRRLAAVGGAGTLLLAACGGGASASATLLRDAPKRTTDARTARMEVAVDQSGAKGQQAAAPIKIDGEADFSARRGHMLIDLSQLGLPGPPIDAVFDNAMVYEKFPPALGAALPPGKSWVKVDLASAGKSVGAAGLSQAQAGDPSQTLDYLRGVTGNVARVGTDEIRGTHTTHYRTTVDLKKAAEQSPTARDRINSTIKLLGSSAQPLDVWIDAQGRVRRINYTVDLSKSKATTPSIPGSATFTLDLFDFGVPVQATVPPADQIADLSALSGGR
jgi:hypothetical protein